MASKFKWANGTWFNLALMALWANTTILLPIFCAWVRFLSQNLPCEECSKHMQAYVAAHPPEDEDPFVWVWKFHNSVNTRLGKPVQPYHVVRDYFVTGTGPLYPGGTWKNGTWFTLHLLAMWADDLAKISFFGLWVRFLSTRLPAADMATHMQNFLVANPPESEDPFLWAWKFHNAVNRRRHKPEIEYNTIRDLYFGGKFRACDTTCSAASRPSASASASSSPPVPDAGTSSGTAPVSREPATTENPVGNRFIPSHY